MSNPILGLRPTLLSIWEFWNRVIRFWGCASDQGGHLTHGSPANLSGKYYNFISYGVDQVTETIDYDEIEKLIKEHQPKLVVVGASSYPRAIDFERISKLTKAAGCYLMVDMAHIAGLVAAGQHQSPVPYADLLPPPLM